MHCPALRRAHPGIVRAFATAAMTALAGCHGAMSIFDPASHESAMITSITWWLIIASAVIYAIVCMVLIRAAARRHDASATGIDLTPRPEGAVIWFGAIVPVAILFVLFLMTLTAMRRYPASEATDPANFHITAHQWWWDVAWVDSTSGRTLHTANEIHVPVGRPVRIILTSDDVIHTFWVPQLQGKIDLIPGDTTEVRFTALRPGAYRGQCAEYCGAQHAHMALVVVAEPPAAFAEWLATEAQAAPEPHDSAATAGRRLVVAGPCASCHTIRGTGATGMVGPDLTHVGSRLTLAAGALPNNIGTMEAWITSAQSLKPGVAMPSLRLFTGDELRAVAAYLEGLR